MSRVSFSLFVVMMMTAVVLMTSTLTFAQVINYQNCTDTILCRPETCQTETLNSQQCQDISKSPFNPMSQQLFCNPQVTSCLELVYFSDRFCTVPKDSISVPCGHCDKSGVRLECIAENGVESVLGYQCSDPFTCQKDCKVKFDVPRGDCVEDRKNPGTFIKNDGAVLCTVVDQVLYNDKSCSGKYQAIVPIAAGHCIDGKVLDCKYGNGTLKDDRHALKKIMHRQH